MFGFCFIVKPHRRNFYLPELHIGNFSRRLILGFRRTVWIVTAGGGIAAVVANSLERSMIKWIKILQFFLRIVHTQKSQNNCELRSTANLSIKINSWFLFYTIRTIYRFVKLFVFCIFSVFNFYYNKHAMCNIMTTSPTDMSIYALKWISFFH